MRLRIPQTILPLGGEGLTFVNTVIASSVPCFSYFADLATSQRNSPEGALERYEKRLHAFMLGKQEAAKKFAGSFRPKTRLGVFLRNQVTKTFGIPFVAKWIMGSTLLDHLELPDY
jgi:2-polyprenyl-6-methoxyphenol hydroxylase-like FAD-dependent oxidoreductase